MWPNAGRSGQGGEGVDFNYIFSGRPLWITPMCAECTKCELDKSLPSYLLIVSLTCDSVFVVTIVTVLNTLMIAIFTYFLNVNSVILL